MAASSTEYRRALLRGYLEHERAAVAAVRTAGQRIARVIEARSPSKILHVAPTIRAITPHLKSEASALRATLRSAYRDAATVTFSYHAARSGRSIDTGREIAALLKTAQGAVVAEHTVGGRISLLAGQQKHAARTRLILGIKRGESPEQLVAGIQKLYIGAVDGSSGAAYSARRLVQSELTRFHGRLAEEAAYRLRKATGRITILVFNTQGDERVRSTHAHVHGTQFVEDVVASASGYSSLSEAQSYLAEVNCRCWLDVAGYA